MSNTQLLEGIDDNVTMHFAWGPGQAPGMRVHSDASFTLVDSGLPTSGLNAVCRVRPPIRQLPEWVAKVPLWFAHTPVPFTCWISPEYQSAALQAALLGANFQQQPSRVAMAVELAALPTLDHLPLWLEVRRTTTFAELEAYAALQAVNASPPNLSLNEYYDLTAPHLLSATSPINFYVGYLDGVPVAAAQTVVTGELAGLYGVATLEAHRGQGIGAAMALTALRACVTLGCTRGVLLAPPALTEGCQRLGFVAHGEFSRYSLVSTIEL